MSLSVASLSEKNRKSTQNLSYGDFVAQLMLWQKAIFLIPIWGIPVVIGAGTLFRFLGNRMMEGGYTILLSALILYFMQDLLKRRISMDDDNIYFGFRSIAIKNIVGVDLKYKKSKFVPSTLVLLDKNGGTLKFSLSGLTSDSVEAMMKHLQTRNSTLKLAPILLAMVKCHRIKPAPMETPERLELHYYSRKVIVESIDAVKSAASKWMRFGPLLAFFMASCLWTMFFSSIYGGSSISELRNFELNKFLMQIGESIGFHVNSLIQKVWSSVGTATENPYVTTLLLVSLLVFILYLVRFVWRPTAIVADQEGLRFVLRAGQICISMSKVAWSDIEKMSLLSSTGKGGILSIERKNGNRFSVNLSNLTNDDRGLLLKRVEANVPNCVIEHDLVQSMLPNSDHSYTEIWLQSLNQPRERKTLDPLEPGQVLAENRFQVLQSLGVGGQGTAYLCRQFSGNDQIVLKETILPVFTDNALRRKAIEKFDQEAKLLKSLEHPGIVRLDDYFIEDHRAYLIMEHVKGCNLRDLVIRNGPLDQLKVRELAEQMCEILIYLHEQNVVHRDFTPDNLILGPDGRLKLIDFNVAQQIQSGATGTIVGKHAYLPPEQFRGKATAQSDLYALGATMYFLLTGSDPEPISQSAPKLVANAIDDEGNEIVKRATSLQTSKRYQTAQEILADLNAWEGNVKEPLLIEVDDFAHSPSGDRETISSADRDFVGRKRVAT